MATAKKSTNTKKTETAGEKIAESLNEQANKKAGIVKNASRIVFKAATVLEEEIAKGIIAAKQIEEKLTDVPRLQSGIITNNKPVDDLIGRFRKDAHNIMDLILDFAAIAAQNAQKISGQLITVRQQSGKKVDENLSQVSLIQVPGELKPGEQVNFPVTLENDNPVEERSVYFENTLPADTNGNQLPASALSFEPNPLIIPASSKATVNVKIAIPKAAKAGSYTCFLQARKMEALKATILIKVVV